MTPGRDVLNTRILITAVAVIVGGVLIAGLLANRPEPVPDHESVTLRLVGLDTPIQNRLAARFADADGDLVADAPADPGEILDPAELAFSYIANASENEKLERAWAGFVAHLSRETGRRVVYRSLPSQADQLRELQAGRLHVTGLNAGSVPRAVNDCGFVPLCTPGDEHGIIGYAMQLIVPAASPIAAVADLKGRTLALTQPGSNSGCKAPLVLLMQDFGLQVERDYYICFSRGHEESIRGVADGLYEAAAVAGDLLQQAIADGLVADEDFRVIYESERFSTAALGVPHRLAPDLVASIRQAFLAFDWAGSGLEAEFAALGADRFVPVNYKDDWALIRRIDDAVGVRHEVDSVGDAATE